MSEEIECVYCGGAHTLGGCVRYNRPKELDENGDIPTTDFDLFIGETVAFVNKCAPEVAIEKRNAAVAQIVRNFQFLFNEDGGRISQRRGGPDHE